MRDDEYQQTAKALARETRMSDASAARIEETLLAALSPGGGANPVTWLATSHRKTWLASAAAVVLIAGSIALWNVSRTKVNATTTPPARVASEKTSIPTHDAVPPPPQSVVLTSAKAPEVTRRHATVHKTQTPRVISPTGFVALPASAGLPAFESGEIVRMEVPVASLPAYGIDISPGVGTRPLEADLLIGQDGFARAIRLVKNTARSTQ